MPTSSILLQMRRMFDVKCSTWWAVHARALRLWIYWAILEWWVSWTIFRNSTPVPKYTRLHCILPVSTAVYPPLWICCCVSATGTVYQPLCICRCVSPCICRWMSTTVSTTVSTTEYPPLCICRCVSATVLLCICHCVFTTMYPLNCIWVGYYISSAVQSYWSNKVGEFCSDHKVMYICNMRNLLLFHLPVSDLQYLQY
jgi:hypothetical protein